MTLNIAYYQRQRDDTGTQQNLSTGQQVITSFRGWAAVPAANRPFDVFFLTFFPLIAFDNLGPFGASKTPSLLGRGAKP